MGKKPYRNGFTLIELALSMVFVALLGLAIALVTRDTIVSYRRGLTLNQINTVGMDIVDDMRAAVQNSGATSILNDCVKYYYKDALSSTAYDSCVADQGYDFVYWVKKENVVLNEGTSNQKDVGEVPVYGAFCTGTYSYIWNSGYYETDNASFASKNNKKWAKLRYVADASRMDETGMREALGGTLAYEASQVAGNPGYYNVIINGSKRGNGDMGNPDKPFRLLKVRDDRRSVCVGVVRNKAGGASGFNVDYEAKDGDLGEVTGFDGVFDMTDYIPVEANEPPMDIIVTDKTYDLAIYDLFAARPAISSTQKNMFYSASFILGTVNGGINILAQGKSCAAPSEYAVENYDYCSINKFSFAVQSGQE